MSHYVGIDLGTTNSVVCSFDGENVHLYKSPEQNSVTPSAIYVDGRSRYYGARAYRKAAFSPGKTATHFKRLMGTSTPIHIRDMNLTMSPEECSAEILQLLFGYLPEEIRGNEHVGTVITVPAAFNQMQKDATMTAANMAGIGLVALMQEPVAAVMSVMRTRKTSGMFLIFDLGGGTLDIALAESISGRVTLHEHGGVAMCGGRDFDRLIVDNLVKPWLLQNFSLPVTFSSDPRFHQLVRLAGWAAEQAKIELGSKNTSTIYLTEDEIRIRDEAGKEIYFEVEVSREMLNELISPKVQEGINAVNDVLERAHLSPGDMEKIVFIGGPTQYKPLRDRISRELGIPGTTDVDPMTAVAEGAAIFAESVDWTDPSRGRKAARASISIPGTVAVRLNYHARTPEASSRVVTQVTGKPSRGATFEVQSKDTGWSSGRVALQDGASVSVPLSRNGENRFKVSVYASDGSSILLPEDAISIHRTSATIDGIPASHSIGVSARERAGGTVRLDYLVRAGDPLPKKGRKTFRAEVMVQAGASGEIVIALWEGEIEEPYSDNRQIGALKITGSDFDDGVIRPNDELICDYEVLDSGAVSITVSVPSVGGTFTPGHNFYSRQEGLINYADATAMIREETEKTRQHIEEIASKVADSNLDKAYLKLDDHADLTDDADPEQCKQAMDNVLEAKRLIGKVSASHKAEMRQMKLDRTAGVVGTEFREICSPAEMSAIDSHLRAAQLAIDRDSADFDRHMDEAGSIIWGVLWRQSWFVVSHYDDLKAQPWRFSDPIQYRECVAVGDAALKREDFDELRRVCFLLAQMSISIAGEEMIDRVNILRG